MNTKQKEILDFIIRYKRENDGNSPGVQQIADACGLSSTSSVDYHLNKLEEEGEITRKGVRSIKVIGGEWSLEKEQT